MIQSLDVYVSECCTYCVNLKIILKKLISKNIITYPVTFIEIDLNDPRPAPIMVKNIKKGKPQTLRGLPVRKLLYKFLEVKIDEDGIDSEPIKKTGKIFEISE